MEFLQPVLTKGFGIKNELKTCTKVITVMGSIWRLIDAGNKVFALLKSLAYCISDMVPGNSDKGNWPR